ncbi:hypothetical protein BGW42_003082 [Actinomortierella wolfii]|nr:hypothetical protein BGW42_003082 [Actinomortierella wolfii]
MSHSLSTSHQHSRDYSGSALAQIITPRTSSLQPWHESSAASSSNTLQSSAATTSTISPLPSQLTNESQRDLQQRPNLPLQMIPPETSAAPSLQSLVFASSEQDGPNYPLPPTPRAPSSIHSTLSYASSLDISNPGHQLYPPSSDPQSQAASSSFTSSSSSTILRSRCPPPLPLKKKNGDKEPLLRLEQLDTYPAPNPSNEADHPDATKDKGKGKALWNDGFSPLGDNYHPAPPYSPTRQLPPVASGANKRQTSEEEPEPARRGSHGLKANQNEQNSRYSPFHSWAQHIPQALVKKIWPSAAAGAAPSSPRSTKHQRKVEQVFEYSNGELKTMFSNERIYLEWIKVSLLLGSLSMTMLSFGSSGQVTPWIGLALILCTLLLIVYSTTQFHVRMEWLLKQRDEEEGAYYYDRLGPTVLTVLLIGIMAFNAYEP